MSKTVHMFLYIKFNKKLLQLFSKELPFYEIMHSYHHYNLRLMEVGIQESKTFIIILNIFESRQKINTALVTQSPQKQLLLSFIYFYGVYFGFLQRYIYLLQNLALNLFSQMA